MKTLLFTLDNTDCLTFGASIITTNDFEKYNEEGILEEGPFQIVDAGTNGPLFTDDCKSLEYSCKLIDEGEMLEGGLIAEIPTFNTNKEIMTSNFFTPDQAEYVRDTVKQQVSEYYKTWADGYRSLDDKLFEIEERGNGRMKVFLDFTSPFNKDNLFFVLADILPFKETVIAVVGYKNPDGTITSATFEFDNYISYAPVIKYDNKEY